MIEKLESTPATILELWMVSAAIVTFALGVQVDLKSEWSPSLILAIGLIIHSYSMYKIYSQ